MTAKSIANEKNTWKFDRVIELYPQYDFVLIPSPALQKLGVL